MSGVIIILLLTLLIVLAWSVAPQKRSLILGGLLGAAGYALAGTESPALMAGMLVGGLLLSEVMWLALMAVPTRLAVLINLALFAGAAGVIGMVMMRVTA